MIKKIIIVSIVLVSIIISSCGVVPPIQNVNYRILLIGAGDYDGCNNDLSAPPYAVDSMEELFSRCYDIEMLTMLKDGQATKKNILDEIYYTFKDAKEDDVSILYWAGHGGKKNNTFQICPVDYLTNGRISIIELEYLLDNTLGTKIVILDTCHSGGFIGKNTFKLLNRPGYQVLTSCMGEQVCYQMQGTSFSDPYMVFTRGIIRGCEETYLADIDNDGIVTMTEAYNFAVDWVSDHFSYGKQDAQIYPEGSTFPLVEY